MKKTLWLALIITIVVGAISSVCSSVTTARAASMSVPRSLPLRVASDEVYVDGNGRIVWTGFQLTVAGRTLLRADRAEATVTDVNNVRWSLTGHVQMHMPEGDLHSDYVTVRLRNGREVLAATDDGDWTALSKEPSALTQTMTDRALVIMYDILNQDMVIEAPTGST
jgi:lipopolysaccharide export system protein LptA